MGLNSDIADVTAQMDKIFSEDADRWFNLADYNLKNKDRKNMKSVYGLIHNILHYEANGQRIIDRTRKDSLDYLYQKCIEHMKKRMI